MDPPFFGRHEFSVTCWGTAVPRLMKSVQSLIKSLSHGQFENAHFFILIVWQLVQGKYGTIFHATTEAQTTRLRHCFARLKILDAADDTRQK